VEPTDTGDWPLEWFCDQLSQDLFSTSWETRHGAATALREIITVHGRGAGKTAYSTPSQIEECHQIWLEDMAIRLLCVLALDRFGDFVSDAVVAPVRETCAQSLCAILKLMEENGCKGALKILLQLLNHQEWEARHGGLLGLKYLLAVREDMVNTLLPEAFPYILQGLSDNVDDVAAVAASALIPVTAKLVQLVPEFVPLVVIKLWDLLAEQDELAAACNSFMGLLAAILNLPEAQQLLPAQPLNDVVPRLWPFLSHSASSVRKATLQTLGTLTERPSDGSSIRWEAQLLQDAMRHVYQRVLVEPQTDVRGVAEKVWGQLVENSGLVELLHAACPFITVWLFLSMQPTRVPFDPNYLIYAKTHRKKALVDGLHSFDHTVVMPKCYIGGTETTPFGHSREQLGASEVHDGENAGVVVLLHHQAGPGDRLQRKHRETDRVLRESPARPPEFEVGPAEDDGGVGDSRVGGERPRHRLLPGGSETEDTRLSERESLLRRDSVELHQTDARDAGFHGNT
jgi:TATA-binding protein-associated factor